MVMIRWHGLITAAGMALRLCASDCSSPPFPKAAQDRTLQVPPSQGLSSVHRPLLCAPISASAYGNSLGPDLASSVRPR